MIKKNLLIIVYLIIVFILLIASVFNFENLRLISKPVLIPLLIYYYLEAKKSKYRISSLLALLFYFLGENLLLIEDQKTYPYYLILFVTPYFILIYRVFGEFRVNFNKYRFNYSRSFFLFLVVLLLYLIISILNLISTEQGLEFYLFLSYAISLFVLIFSGVYNFTLNKSKKNYYFIISMILAIVSDLFYIFSLKIENLMIFTFLNVIPQWMSFYYMVKYFIYDETQVQSTSNYDNIELE